MNLRIATYNIHRCVGIDRREQPERIAKVLQELRADVVALQEVAHGSDGRDVLEYLAHATGSRAIDGYTLSDHRGEYGNAVLTSLEVSTVSRIDLSVPRHEPRGAVDIEVDAGGVSVQIVATHLGLRPRERRYQARRLLERIQSSRADGQVLLGDLNEWFLWGRPLRTLRRVFGRWPSPPTFPSFRPVLALDQIMLAPASFSMKVHVHRSATARVASDHLPLIADVGTRTPPKT